MSIDKIIASIPDAAREKRDGMRRNALEKLEDNDPKWRADAERLLAALEQQDEQEHAELIAEVAGMAPAERVVRAFTAELMTETEEKLIRVLIDNPGSTLATLTEKLGWQAQSWHLHFGTMCANCGIYLGPPPYAQVAKGKFYSGILADFVDEGSLFTMKPDVAAAFAKLGIRVKS